MNIMRSPAHISTKSLQFLLRFLAMACLLQAAPLWATPLPVQLTVGELELAGMKLVNVQLQTEGEGLRIKAASAALEGDDDLRVQLLDLHCPELGSASAGWCPQGQWNLQVHSDVSKWQQALQGKITAAVWNDAEQKLDSTLSAGTFNAQLEYLQVEGSSAARVKWTGQALVNLPFRAMLPEQLEWIKAGSSAAVLAMDLTSPEPGLRVDYQITLNDLSMDSPEGLYAAEGLSLQSSGQWQAGARSQLSVNAKFLAGEVLLDRFYTAFGPQPLEVKAQIQMSDQQVTVTNLQLSDEGAMKVQASASFSPQDPANTLEYQVKQLSLQFPVAYERYLASVLAAWTLDKLTVTGGFSWTGSGIAGDFPSGTLEFDDLSVVDHLQNRFAFTGMSAHIEAGSSSGVSDFSWQGLLLGRINLGAGKLQLKTAPGEFELAAPLSLAVLGGEFVVDRFRFQLPSEDEAQAEPLVNFNAVLKEMDLQQLTEALGWPAFAGKISGSIPGVSLDAGVLTVDGLLSFEVFDGQVELSNVKVERPFGVLPSFAADLTVDNLDLQQLTSAFSFGRIAGRLDGYVNELRMLDWSPVSFDAWMGTPERQSDSNQISRQAVNSLTSIGGGGATAALTGPIMRMFSNFSYRRLGMGCKLENYVCAIRGLADESDSVVIMEGSGVPKLMIKVFNRRMDFPQLVANLEAASSGEGIRIGDP